ncbi:MAG: T9SS type A sorting domain-containing protein [Saprospiraceae bacterium]|nr:T9SS type A sorting domain-containing protein [Saprospiraceae bacterium]
MKRNFYYIILFVFFIKMISDKINAQTLTVTNYVGALSSDPNKDWTEGWTNWNPNQANYPAVTDTVTLNGMLSTLPVPGELKVSGTLTLNNSKVYLLKGLLVITDGATLVIPEGTLIRSQSDLNSNPKNYASIIVERGGKIIANGTKDKPIVFTSNNNIGQRNRGDWGGVLIAGKALHNLSNTNFDNVQMEGFNNISFNPNLAKFGGNQPNDNSGSLHYVRLEFGGLAFEANKEINALTLGAVGSQTSIHHIQSSFSNDDSFEWFGGSVNSKYLIAYKGTDDDFDTDNGYSGVNQFGIGIRDTSLFDLTYNATSGASTSEGFESDNEGTGTANVKPYTNAVFSNYTMVGPVPVGTKYSELNSTARSAFRRGARIRRNSSLRIVNSIFMGYRNFLMIDADSSLKNTNDMGILTLLNEVPVDQVAKQLYFSNNLIVNTSSAFTSTTDTTANGLAEVARGSKSLLKLNALTSWLRQGGCLANNIDPVAFTSGTVLTNPLASSTTPDFKPVANSPALQGADFTCNSILRNLTVSVKEISESTNALFFPNPVTQGKIFFHNTVESYGLFNLQGELVISGLDTDNADVSGISAGVYLIKIEGKIQKVIIP